ncbi:FAD-binding protein [Paracoccus spongiarum]|uniref:FAD-binding protein n=1 Tax=Paracoccus spongiarum TaxID=3064387 RepID=A0ABT9J8N2_9RHOB|nr:FAD-binding protein [Paracoccus sp. 2205BS29-5]MDP5306174.1 FAD-binding protein [Paracoccus sp. 2205BS29-5]
MRPDSEAALAAMIRDAREQLAIIGGGTGLWPGEGLGQRLDTTGLAGVSLYEPEALTLVVQAGTPLHELRALLAAEGQMLGFEPPDAPGATIGGVVGANASGPRRVQAGAARDSLIGVRLVDGHGEIVKNGGRVMKNVTGYDLVKLMAGSRGRLGVLTQLSLRTFPVPPVRQTLALTALDAPGAVAALTAALTRPFDVSGAAWLPGQGALIRLEGLEGSVGIRAAALRRRLAEFGEIVEAADEVWTRLRPAPGEGDLWRIVCRPGEAAGILSGLPAPLMMDWGGALIHLRLPRDELPVLPRFSGHARRIAGAATMVLPAPDPVARRLESGLRQRFDPRGIFTGVD